MPNRHGDFVWYELLTPDADGAAAFYGSVIGWTTKPSQASGADDYREILMGGEAVGGMLPLTDEMRSGGAVPAWLGYVHVDDLDAQIEGLKAAGATICFGPQEIPGVGRMVMILDPQGVPLYVMTDTSGVTSNAFARHEPMAGHCAWNELSTADPEAAKAFYGAQFGWTKDGEMDMGPMGKYEFLKAGGGSYGLGAVMPKMPEMPVSAWTHYFRVPSIDTAIAAIKANGGQVINGPMEVPGDDWCINGIDPQGAHFALVGGK